MNIVQRIAASVALLALDGAWLYWVMGPMYTRLVPRIQGRPLRSNIVYAVAAYAFMLIGLHLFVLPGDDETTSSAARKNPTVTRGSRLTWGGVARAFAFGAVLYGVYNGTCGAVFAAWDVRISVIDTLWGGLVYALAYCVAHVVPAGRSRERS